MEATGIKGIRTETKRRPGRPSSGQDLIAVSVVLRREQVEWLNEFASRSRKNRLLASNSAIIRGLIDSVFAPRNP